MSRGKNFIRPADPPKRKRRKTLLLIHMSNDLQIAWDWVIKSIQIK